MKRISRFLKYFEVQILLLIPLNFFRMGSTMWLKRCELHFGGLSVKVKRLNVSDLDPRTQDQILKGGMTGGDRMIYNSYASVYSQWLPKKFEEELNIVEVGILKGQGLALWSVLYRFSNIFGLDIDLSHTKKNLPYLQSRGAFSSCNLKLVEFDQFSPNNLNSSLIGDNERFDIIIDDGFHSIEAIMNTLDYMYPYLSEDFVYFIEDNQYVHEKIAESYKEFSVYSYGHMTVLKRKN